ncbi:MAG: tetratricopeptide repeat protein, partial [Bacteroidota bacterium]
MLASFSASLRFLVLLILGGALLCPHLFAQDRLEVTEKSLVLGELEGDTSRVHELLAQADAALREQHNNHLADSLAEIAVGLSQQLEYFRGEAKAIMLRGKVWQAQRKYHSGFQAGQAAMDIFASLQDSLGYYQAQVLEGTCLYGKGEVEAGRLSLIEAVDGLRKVDASFHLGVALNNLGALYKNRGEYTQAIEMLREAAALMEEVGEVQSQGSIYNNIGSCYGITGAKEASRQYYFKALTIFRDHDYDAKAGGALINLGNWYRTEGRYDSALLVLEEAEAIFMDQQMEMDLAIAWFNQALVFDWQEQRELALMYLGKSFPIFQSYNSVAFLIRSNLLQAQIQLQENNPQKALLSAQTAKNLAEKQGMLAYQPLCWELIGDSHRALKHFEKSLNAYLMQADLSDSIDARRQQETLLRIKAEDERLAQEREIQELQEVVNLREKLVTQQNRVIQFQLVGLGLFLALCLLLFIYYRQKNQVNQQLESLVKKRTGELETSNGKLQDTIMELQQFNRIVSHDLKEPLR